MNLTNLRLQAILDEAAEDERRRRNANRQDEDETEEEEETPAEEEEQTEDEGEGEEEAPPEEEAQEDKLAEEEETEEDNPDGEEEDTPAPEGDEPEAATEETPTEGEGTEEGTPGEEGVEGAKGEEGGDDFSVDADDPAGESAEDEGPAPDGLPEADDDGSSDMDDGDEAAETNIHTNILNLSKLDRVVAKRTIYQHFMDLRSTINSTISMIDRNETVIDPDVREEVIGNLNKTLKQLEDFLKYKFQIVNYEDATVAYLMFVKQLDSQIEYVKNDGIESK